MRESCERCRQPLVCCYCAQLRPFTPGIEFALLMHPVEYGKRVATGRLAHLCLRGSHLIRGTEFGRDGRVNALLADPELHPVVLSPGPDAVDLSELSPANRRSMVPAGKRLLVLVIDGTWPRAKKMLRLSPNLRDLPRICFTPEAPSEFTVRTQPREHCLSTAEAIHETLRLLGSEEDRRAAANLLEVQAWVVEREMQFRTGERAGRLPPYRPTKRPLRRPRS